MSKSDIEEARIREAAFHIWLNEGCPEGRAEEHWHRARAQLVLAEAPPKKRRAAPKPKPAAPTRPRRAAARAETAPTLN